MTQHTTGQMATADATASPASDTPPVIDAQVAEFMEASPDVAAAIMALGSVGDAMGFTAENLDTFYAAGYQLFEQGEYANAMTVFSYLSVLDPGDIRFHQAVAACLVWLERYKEAAGSYVLLKLLEPEQPEHLLRLAECTVSAGDPQAAVGILESLIEECIAPEHDELRIQAEAMRKLLRSPALESPPSVSLDRAAPPIASSRTQGNSR